MSGSMVADIPSCHALSTDRFSGAVGALAWRSITIGELWNELTRSAERWASSEPALAPILNHVILRAADYGHALARRIATLLGDRFVKPMEIVRLARIAFADRPEILESSCVNLLAIRRGDPATGDLLSPFVFYKGFAALTVQQVAHHLWSTGRQPTALLLQHRCAAVTGVDLHPAAQLGSGVLMDHATGIVIGETARVGDDVVMFHNITLGGTGNEHGDRHPKIGCNVVIGAGATILGNIRIGDHARIGAGAVVLSPVPPFCLAAGIPAHVTKIYDEVQAPSSARAAAPGAARPAEHNAHGDQQ